jgi:hypothetical protein
MAFRTLPLIILCALLAACSDQGEPGVIAGTAHVIDGDSLELDGERIRLFGIDAPELSQSCDGDPCGEHAAAALRRMIEDRALVCSERDRDRYGRMVAVCHLGEVDIGERMVESRLAVAYTTYSTDYVAAERQARAAEPPPGDCTIKGNISADGEHIYHSPGQEHYDRTRISTGKGERWFCDAAEAEAAGWRAARR